MRINCVSDKRVVQSELVEPVEPVELVGPAEDTDDVLTCNLRVDHIITPLLAMELGIDIDFGKQWSGFDGYY